MNIIGNNVYAKGAISNTLREMARSSENLNENDARFLLGPHFSELRKMPYRAMAQYLSYDPRHLADHDVSLRAQTVHQHVLKEAANYAARFDDRQVAFRVTNNLSYLVFDEYVATRFKKLDRRLQPSNNETMQSRMFRSDYLVLGIPAKISVDLGYTFSEFGDVIESVHLIRWASPTKKHWIIELLEEASTERVVPLVPMPDEETIENDTEDAPSEVRGKQTGDVVPFERAKKDDEN